MWLTGLTEGFNKGKNVDSFNRFIYIHGTHEEGLIGKKASHGCIRMLNHDVLELFEMIPPKTAVNIYLRSLTTSKSKLLRPLNKHKM